MKHPSEFISAHDAEVISKCSAAAEKKGSLDKGQLAVIYKNKWFCLFVPKAFGGLELSLSQGLQIEEGLAYADGSTGWTVTLCSGANWFIGFLKKEKSKQLFRDKKVCFAGSGRPSGIAKKRGNKFEINGNWQYATGAPHATIFTANCLLEKNGKLIKDAAGNPKISSFWFYPKEVTIKKKWSVTGMIATASETFCVRNVLVPISRSFYIEPSSIVLSNCIYRYPFVQFAEATLAVNFSGMVIRFLDLFEQIFVMKQPDKYVDEESILFVKKQWKSYSRRVNQSRKKLYDTVDKSWQQLEQQDSIDESILAQISKASRQIASLSRKVINDLYPYCGLIAANPYSEINRVWRNFHTASQHSLLNFPTVHLK